MPLPEGYNDLSHFPRGLITRAAINVFRLVFATGLRRKIAWLAIANGSASSQSVNLTSGDIGIIYATIVVPIGATVLVPPFFAPNGLRISATPGDPALFVSGAYFHPGDFETV